MKMNTTDRKVMANVAIHGFTFANDNLFRTVRAGRTCLNRLVKMGWLMMVVDQFGISYRITDTGRDAVAHPASSGLMKL